MGLDNILDWTDARAGQMSRVWEAWEPSLVPADSRMTFRGDRQSQVAPMACAACLYFSNMGMQLLAGIL